VTLAAGAAAGRFAAESTTIYNGVIGPWFLPEFAGSTGLDHLDYVVLLPPLETCLERVATRRGHGFTDVDATRHMYDQFATRCDTIDPRHLFVDPPEHARAAADRIVEAAGSGMLRYEIATAQTSVELVTIVVDEYDPAIRFFVDALGFELVEDSPAVTNGGAPKRWVVVRPPGHGTAILLARADGDEQRRAIGNQAGGRVGFFLRVDDFDAAHARMTAAAVTFLEVPRDEPYGRVAVFLDIAGNRWDLLGPPRS
jgi:catechol 2,3-dioxygenase-like lactoylglutathione lyase family enzyme